MKLTSGADGLRPGFRKELKRQRKNRHAYHGYVDLRPVEPGRSELQLGLHQDSRYDEPSGNVEYPAHAAYVRRRPCLQFIQCD